MSGEAILYSFISNSYFSWQLNDHLPDRFKFSIYYFNHIFRYTIVSTYILKTTSLSKYYFKLFFFIFIAFVSQKWNKMPLLFLLLHTNRNFNNNFIHSTSHLSFTVISILNSFVFISIPLSFHPGMDSIRIYFQRFF